MSSIIKVFALTRIATGTALLLAPHTTCAVFLLPSAPVATLAIRLAGARDFAVGGLLLYSHGQRTLASTKDDKSQEPLLGEAAGREAFLGSVLWTGIAIDAIDILSCAACLAEGTVPLDGAAMFTGGAALFFGLGLWGLRSLK